MLTAAIGKQASTEMGTKTHKDTQRHTKTLWRDTTHRSLHRVGCDHGPALDQDTIHSAHPRLGATVCVDPGKEEGGEEEGGEEEGGDNDHGRRRVGVKPRRIRVWFANRAS